MPSSSTRSTHLECRLRNLFKLAWTRLHFAQSHTWAAFLTIRFSELLDIPKGNLIASLKPPLQHMPLGAARTTVLAEHEFFDKLAQEAKAKKVSVCVGDAGDVVSEVGILLTQSGRDDEGSDWGGWGRMLWELAENEAEKERMWEEQGEKRRRDSDWMVGVEFELRR